MAGSSEKSVREKVFQNLKVDIKYGKELSKGIIECLEVALCVSKENLSNELVKQFDLEVKQMYEYFPRRMKKCSRSKSEVIRKSRFWFDKKIELVEAPVVVVQAPNVEVVNRDVDVGYLLFAHCCESEFFCQICSYFYKGKFNQ